MNLHSISGPIIKSQPLCHCRKSKSGPFSCADRMLNFQKTLFFHTLPIIRYPQDQIVPSFLSLDQYFSPASFVFYSMIQSVFSQRLKRQLWNHNFIKFFRNMNLKFQNIPVSGLLDLQITDCMSFFLGKGDHIVSL